jgi:hypothetical protein
MNSICPAKGLAVAENAVARGCDRITFGSRGSERLGT